MQPRVQVTSVSSKVATPARVIHDFRLTSSKYIFSSRSNTGTDIISFSDTLTEHHPRKARCSFTFALISKLRLVRCLTLAQLYSTEISLPPSLIPRLDLSDLHTGTNKYHARLYFALNSNYENTRRYRENRGPKLRIHRNGFRFSRSTTGIYLLVHGSVYPRVCATDVCLLVNICISMVNTTSYAVHDFRLTSCLLRLLLQTRFQISIAWNRKPWPFIHHDDNENGVDEKDLLVSR